jgi:F-type H+-transporting ATPase subunit delta
MTNKTAATRYARALLEVALNEKGDLQKIEQDLAAFVDLFTKHPTLEKVLLAPTIPVTRKRATAAALTSRLGTSPVAGTLITMLAERDRLELLVDLLASYRERLLDHQNVVRAIVTTATPLDADRARVIERSLAQLSGRPVTLATNVDPSIIGGIVARIGSTVYDGSITTQLQKMKQRLTEAV